MGIDFSKLDTRNRDPGIGIQPDSYHGPEPSGERRDKYPDNMVGKGNYHDAGCSIAPSCLECPLPECRYDARSNTVRVAARDRRIRRSRERGQRCDSLAKRFGLSTRSIHRIVQRKAGK